MNNVNYNKLADKQIVEKILALPHNEEAAYFLLQVRYFDELNGVYKNVLKKINIQSIRGDSYIEDCIQELFIHLRSKDCSWHTLATFEWRSSFKTWLKKIAHNKFLEVLPKLIDKRGFVISIDTDDPERPNVQIPVEDEDSYERRQRKVLLLEAINQLNDADQRFVILKRLDGYNSNEIAILLQKRGKNMASRSITKKMNLLFRLQVMLMYFHSEQKRILVKSSKKYKLYKYGDYK